MLIGIQVVTGIEGVCRVLILPLESISKTTRLSVRLMT